MPLCAQLSAETISSKALPAQYLSPMQGSGILAVSVLPQMEQVRSMFTAPSSGSMAVQALQWWTG